MVAEATGRFLGASPSEKAQLKERYAKPRDADAATGTTDTTPKTRMTTTAVR
jgi:hypothetical protein